MMPKLSGFEVCKQLKGDPATKGIMILMVTALNELGDIERAVNAGTDDFLSKPVNKLELLKRVEIMLRLRHVEDEVERLRRYIEGMEDSTGPGAAARAWPVEPAPAADMAFAARGKIATRHGPLDFRGRPLYRAPVSACPLEPFLPQPGRRALLLARILSCTVASNARAVSGPCEPAGHHGRKRPGSRCAGEDQEGAVPGH